MFLCPQQESNPHFILRKDMSYPLNDEGRNIYSLQFLHQLRKARFLARSGILIESLTLHRFVECLLHFRHESLSTFLVALGNKFLQRFDGGRDSVLPLSIEDSLAARATESLLG